MKLKLTFIFCFLLLTLVICAQEPIPHVKGNVIISVKRGTIECDVTLSNMPNVNNYYLRLNSGMNLRYIKNAEPNMLPLRYERSMNDTLSSGESTAYYISGANPFSKYLPKTIRFNYVGMFPVINDSSAVVDWRGNIAFNGTTLRADGVQSAWCPILYDIETDKSYERVSYDLDINCEDCKVIYMNGSEPVSGTHAKLSSTNAQDLTMFLGDIKAQKINGDYFFNADANFEELGQLNTTLHSYQSYFEKKLNIPYNGEMTYIQAPPVSKKNSFMFVSYPTVVNVDWKEGMKSFVNKEKGARFSQFMAHELAHYYFGTVRVFNSAIGDMISEGFAEYLAMHITRKLISDKKFSENLDSKVHDLRNFHPQAIANITSKKDYQDRELYVYYYAPLLFLAIEQEIGEDKMWEWMRSLLVSQTVFTDYSFFTQTLSKVIQNETKYNQIVEKYFNSDNSFQNILSTLKIPTQSTIPVSSVEKSNIKTYYYFFFSRPIFDIGSTQNNIIAHTEIGKIDCTEQELSDLMYSQCSLVRKEATNETGSNCEFNTYNSKEEAQAALKQWLQRFTKNGNMKVKIVKL